MRNETVTSLLMRWEEALERGQELTPEQLCASKPELIDAVRECLQVVQQFRNLGATPAPPTTQQTRSHPHDPSNECSVPDGPPGYEILGILGRGGMGVVYKARQVGLNRLVALKMIRAVDFSDEDLKRFRTEGEAIARLHHPNIVQVYEIGEYSAVPFFSFEFCPGGSLDRILKGAMMPPRHAAALVEALARAVSHAHQAHIVHRDLKPANVLLSGPHTQLPPLQSDGKQETSCSTLHEEERRAEWEVLGIPKISDFGLARKLDEDGQTQTGALLGTPSYMAPEQAQGDKHIGPSADIYALGTILYECLTGRPPFCGVHTHDTLLQVLTAEPVPPSRLRSGVPRDLETICLKCLRKEPSRRYASGLELAEDLQRYLAGEPIRARPVGFAEQVWRWCRRKPTLAASIALAAVSLVCGTATASAFAILAQQERRAANEAREAETVRAEGERAARDEADHARRQAQQQLVDLSMNAGLAAAREGDHSRALLWFTRAVTQADDFPEIRHLARIRVGNWLRQVPRPIRVFPVPGFHETKDAFAVFEFHPSGKHLLVQVGLRRCYLWELSGDRLLALPGGERPVSASVFSPKGDLLAVGMPSGEVEVFSFPDLVRRDCWSVGRAVHSVSFSRDGLRLAWGGEEGAGVRDLRDHADACPRLAFSSTVRFAALAPAGDRLATVTDNNELRVHRLAGPGKEAVILLGPLQSKKPDLGHGDGGSAWPVFRAEGKEILACQADSQVAWWDLETGKQKSVIQATESHSTSAISQAVSPDGRRGAFFWWGSGRIVDFPQNYYVASFHHPEGNIMDGAWDATGARIVTGASDNEVRLWFLRAEAERTQIVHGESLHHARMPVRCRFSPDGNLVAVGCIDGTILVWYLPPKGPAGYRIPVKGTTRLSLDPAGRVFMPSSTSFRNATLTHTRAYDTKTGHPAGPQLHTGGVLTDAVFSPDGQSVALAIATGETIELREAARWEPGAVEFRDWRTGQRLLKPVATPTEPRGLSFSPDGQRLAIACADGWVLVASTTDGRVLQRLDSGIRSRPFYPNLWVSNGLARFSPDGRWLVTCEMATEVQVWEVQTGRILHRLPHGNRICALDFGPEPHQLVCSCRDCAVYVWDLRSGQMSLPALRHPRIVSASRYAFREGCLLTACEDGYLRHWNLRDGQIRFARRIQPDLLHDLAMNHEGQVLVTAGLNEVNVVDVKGGAPLMPPLEHRYVSLCAQVTSDGKRGLVSGFGEQIIGIDLEQITTPTDLPADRLTLLAELSSGRQIGGTVQPLTSEEWAARWRKLIKADPAFLAWPAPGP